MKIDFLITSLRRGGAERVLVTLANNLANRDYKVKIITFKNEIEYDLDKKIEHLYLNQGSPKNQTIGYTRSLYKYYKKDNTSPDVAISFMTQTSLSAIIVCKLLGIKVIASEHTNHSRTSTNKTLVNFTRKYIYKLANYVTILTNYDLEFYKKHIKNITVLSNPCSFKKNSFPKAKKEKVILAVGGLDKYHIKGFDNLLPVVKPILDEHKDWKLKLVGDADNTGYSFLKKITTDLKIEDQVIFTGLRNDMQKIMSESEIFVLSSRNEGLPMVLIEAMSQSLACIAYDCVSGPSDIITNNINGILVENQNQQEMRSAINRLIEDTELRNQLALRASDATLKFEVNSICDKWEKLIKEVAGE